MIVTTKLRISNFKSVKELTLECRRVNVFIGEPNTGKSNILEAIGLMSHLCQGSRNIGQFIRFETMIDLFYDHVLENPVEVEFGLNYLKMEFSNGTFVGTFRLGPADSPLAFRTQVFQYGYGGGQSQLMPQLSTQVTPFRFYRFNKKVSFQDPQAEFLMPPDGDNLLHVILTRKDLKKIFGEMFGAFGYRMVFKPPEGKIEIQKEFEDVIISFPYSLSSETLQRIAFYLAAIYSNKNCVISFEEPEAHAFPYYTKYLAERIAVDPNKNQYFIATHNPYFLVSLLEKTEKDDLSAFVTYLDHYQTKARELDDSQKQDILRMGSDVFFNLQKLLGAKD